MNTDQLIKTLSHDTCPSRAPEHLLARNLTLGLLVSALALIATLGLRDGLAAAIVEPLVALKLVLPLLLSAVALIVGLRLARPGSTVANWQWALWLAPAGAALVLTYGYLATPQAARMPAFLGESIGPCLASIPTLSLPILLAMMLVLRNGAVLHPIRAGAVAGLAAGGLGTAIYALHCIEDSPLFYSVWYSVGIAVVAALGAALGPKLLRW